MSYVFLLFLIKQFMVQISCVVLPREIVSKGSLTAGSKINVVSIFTDHNIFPVPSDTTMSWFSS